MHVQCTKECMKKPKTKQYSRKDTFRNCCNFAQTFRPFLHNQNTMLLVLPGVQSFNTDSIRASRATNPREYKVIVPKCCTAWLIIYIVFTILMNVMVWWLVNLTDNPLTGTSFFATQNFFEDHSWCFISPYKSYVDNVDEVNPCIDADLYWDSSKVTASEMYDGQDCTYTQGSQQAYNFCNSDNSVTIEWCQGIFDTVVTDTGLSCGFPQPTLTFVTPSNFSESYLYLDNNGDDSWSWLWVYPAMFDMILILVVVNFFGAPRSIRRNGPVFEIKSACGSETVPIEQFSLLVAFERYNYCQHRFALRGLRYLSFSTFCGTQANNQPLIILLSRNCSSSSYRMAMSLPDYTEFLADNVGPAAPTLTTTYGTTAIPVAQVSQVQKV